MVSLLAIIDGYNLWLEHHDEVLLDGGRQHPDGDGHDVLGGSQV